MKACIISYLLFVLLIAAFARTSFADEPANSQLDSRPNIVLIVSDDHGREAFGAYGNKVIKTPHLDALANEGLRFNHAYATSASCSASRSVLLSGLHNHFNGQYGHSHSYHHFKSFSDISSLPVLLSKIGYRTVQVGKYHIAPREVYAFDDYLSYEQTKPPLARNSIGMAKAAIPIIRNQNEKPFFLYLATSDPHRSNEVNSLGDNVFGNASDTDNEGTSRLQFSPLTVEVPPYLPDTQATRRELAEMYESVTRVDDTVGEIIYQLKKAKKYENTIIIYLSDNGTAMPGAKTTLYDPGVRLPLVIKPAGKYQFKGKVTNAMVSWPDITPTILDAAGYTAKTDEFHGRSFLSVLSSPDNVDDWQEVYGSHTFHEVTMYYPMRSIRTRRYKLIWNIASGLDYPFASDLHESSTWQSAIEQNLTKFGARTIRDYLRRPEFELYDMLEDNKTASETENLFDHPELAELQAELLKKLKTFQEKTNDPWRYKWDYE